MAGRAIKINSHSVSACSLSSGLCSFFGLGLANESRRDARRGGDCGHRAAERGKKERRKEGRNQNQLSSTLFRAVRPDQSTILLHGNVGTLQLF